MFQLVIMWVKEFRKQRKYYMNGSIAYLFHKFGIFRSPSLGNSGIMTYKDDIKWFKRGRGLDDENNHHK